MSNKPCATSSTNLTSRHNPYTRCPPDAKYHVNGQCSCNMEDNFDVDGYSCKHQWDRAVVDAAKLKKKDGY